MEQLEKRLLRNAQIRATKKNLPFDIGVSDIEVPEICPLTQIKLRSHDGKGDSLGGAYESPTLDRVIPELGYIRGNVRVVSLLANALKGSLTNADIMAAAAKNFAQNIHWYVNKDQLYEDISSRYRDGSPVVRDDDGSLRLRDGPPNEGHKQLQFDFDSRRNREDQRS